MAVTAVLGALGTTAAGLSGPEAARRLAARGNPKRGPRGPWQALVLFAAQFRSPITLILLAAAAVSVSLGDVADAAAIFAIVVVGAALGFGQEWSAANALSALAARLGTRAIVSRDGRSVEVPLDEVVPGDVLLLSAGSTIPADCLLVESRDLFVDEATLTGESA